jgi:hypothetical protein
MIAPPLVLSSLLLAGPPLHSQQPANPAAQRPLDPAVKKDGWWIRVDRDLKVESLTWRFSSAADKSDKKVDPVSLTWRKSVDPDNFDLPEAVRLRDVLDVHVAGEPVQAVSSYCVFYGVDAVQRVEFSGSRQHTLNAKARDKRCRP